jgi:type IX secretion system PorP/SprF family membrane protein
MKKLYTFLLLSFLLLSHKIIKAQDPQFTQFYANPLYLNPAFAGSTICPRICFNYRNQWPGIPATYTTTSASFDRYVYGIKSGIGLLVTNDQAGAGTIKTTNVSGIYSYQLTITRSFSINEGFRLLTDKKCWIGAN